MFKFRPLIKQFPLMILACALTDASQAEYLKLPGGFKTQDIRDKKIFLKDHKLTSNRKYLLTSVKKESDRQINRNTYFGTYHLENLAVAKDFLIPSHLESVDLHNSGNFLVALEVINFGSPAKLVEFDINDEQNPVRRWEIEISSDLWSMDDQVYYINNDYAVATSESLIRVIDRKAKKIKFAVTRGPRSSHFVNNIAFDPSRNLIFFSQSDQPKNIEIYNFLTGQRLGLVTLPESIVKPRGLQMEVSPDGNKLYFRNTDGIGRPSKDLLFYLDHNDYEKSKAVIMDYSQFSTPEISDYASGASAFTPDSSVFAAAMLQSKEFVLWDLSDLLATPTIFQTEFEGDDRFGIRLLVPFSSSSVLLFTEYAEAIFLDLNQ